MRSRLRDSGTIGYPTYTTREFRSDRGFASDLAFTVLVAAFILALAFTTVL